MEQVWAIIVAAGRGRRMGSEMGKQYLPLLGKPILAHCVEAFEKCAGVDSIVLVTGDGEEELCRQVLSPFGFRKIYRMTAGGAERQHSVYNGLKELPPDTQVVLIHDGARPFVTASILEDSIRMAREVGSGVVGVPSKDTIKMVDEDGYAIHTPERSGLWVVQTPQTFRYSLILDAHKKAEEDGFLGTDDAVLVERMGQPVRMVMGSYENIKITTPEDLALGEAILHHRS